MVGYNKHPTRFSEIVNVKNVYPTIMIDVKESEVK